MPCLFIAKQRHKDTLHSCTNICSLETLLQSNKVKNIPVIHDGPQLKHDFPSWNLLLHFQWQYSMFMLLPKRLTDTALNETSETSTDMQNIPMGKCKFTRAGGKIPVGLVSVKWVLNCDLYRFYSTMYYQGLPLILRFLEGLNIW